MTEERPKSNDQLTEKQREAIASVELNSAEREFAARSYGMGGGVASGGISADDGTLGEIELDGDETA